MFDENLGQEPAAPANNTKPDDISSIELWASIAVPLMLSRVVSVCIFEHQLMIDELRRG